MLFNFNIARNFGILHLQPEVTNTMKLNDEKVCSEKRKQTSKQKGIVSAGVGLIEIDVARKDNTIAALPFDCGDQRICGARERERKKAQRQRGP